MGEGSHILRGQCLGQLGVDGTFSSATCQGIERNCSQHEVFDHDFMG